MSRVMCFCSDEEVAAVRTALGDVATDLEFTCCDREESVVDEVVAERPDVLIYHVRPGSDADPAVLWLVHHVAPRLPVVLMGEEFPGALPRVGRSHRVRPEPPAVEDIRGAVQEALLARLDA